MKDSKKEKYEFFQLVITLITIFSAFLLLFFFLIKYDENQRNEINEKITKWEIFHVDKNINKTLNEIVKRYSTEKELDPLFLSHENLTEIANKYFYKNTPMTAIKENYCSLISDYKNNPICKEHITE